MWLTVYNLLVYKWGISRFNKVCSDVDIKSQFYQIEKSLRSFQTVIFDVPKNTRAPGGLATDQATFHEQHSVLRGLRAYALTRTVNACKLSVSCLHLRNNLVCHAFLSICLLKAPTARVHPSGGGLSARPFSFESQRLPPKMARFANLQSDAEFRSNHR
jgi:hypothetical protein